MRQPAPERFVLVLPASATDADILAAQRLYPGVDVIRSRPIPVTVTKERQPCP